MSVEIKPNHLSLVVFPIAMVFEEGDNEQLLAKATAFFYKRNEKTYLITNWHNVTGLNSITRLPLSNNGGIPNVLRMPLLSSINPLQWQECGLTLYENNSAVWFVHPVYKEKIDVVAIEITIDEPLEVPVNMTPINSVKFDDFDLKIADDVFVLGYPYNLSGGFHFPIWKRGSVASEPDIDYDDLPKILIDTASKPGMSGSPVIFRRTGLHAKSNKLDLNSIFGEIQGFVGVYSGRILSEVEFDVCKKCGEKSIIGDPQLGIVWKKSVIDEIIDGGIKDSIEF